MTPRLTLEARSRLIGAVLILGASMPSPGEAQGRRGEFTLDLNLVGLTAGVAGVVGPDVLVGVEAGLGGDALNVMLLSGRHFSQGGLLSYETRDEYGGERLWEYAHASLVVRRRFSPSFQLDAGVRIAGYAHWDDSDDEPGDASFGGIYLAPMWGGRRFKVGPRLLIGSFSEGPRPELGVFLSIATGRLTFGW